MYIGKQMLLFFVLFCTCIFIWILLQDEPNNIPRKAVDGQIEMSNLDGMSNTVKLDGMWAFYANTFTHTNSDKGGNQLDPAYIQVPAPWNKQKVKGKAMRAHSYGTYKIDIRIPAEQIGQTFGLYVPSVATAYKLWIDDALVLKNGEIGTSRQTTVPAVYARNVYFQAEDDVITLTVEVANFSHRNGGLWKSIQWGIADRIALKSEKMVALQSLIVGSLLIMGVYNIFVYYLRKRIIYALYLGILCMLFAVRTLLIDQILLVRFFPSFPWELQMKLEYIPIVLGTILLMKYITHLFPHYRVMLWEKIIIGLSAVFSVYVLLTPAAIYSARLDVLLINVIIGLSYIAYILARAFFDGKTTSIFTILTFAVFILAFINDSLFYLNVIHTGAFVSEGFLLFLLSQTFVHAVKFSEASHNVEELSNKLLEANVSLEKKVEERTHKLSLLYKRLQVLYEKLLKTEESRKRLMSDVSHELNRPLTIIKGYSEALADHKLSKEEKYLDLIYHNAKVTERLIRDLSELSYLESKEKRIIFQEVPAKQYPEIIYKQTSWIADNAKLSFDWTDSAAWLSNVPDAAIFYMDADRMNQVFMNVIQNAVNYSDAGQSIEFRASFEALDRSEHEHTTDEMYGESLVFSEKGVFIGYGIFCIVDEGEGIAAEDIPFIFNRLYRGNYRKQIEGRGLGLAIAKEIVELHGGRIWAESDQEKGSVFYLSLPVYEA